MQRSVNHVNSIQILYTNPLSHSILQLHHDHLMHGDLIWSNPLLLNPLLGMLTYQQQQIIFLNGQKLCHLKKCGAPRYIITNNEKLFYNKLMNNLCERFNFKQHNSSMYNASTNGLAKAFNKTLGNLLKKIVDKSKRDWHECV